MIENGVTIRRVTKQVAIKRLRVNIARFERRYECHSHDMIQAVTEGRVRETAEVSKWLTNYRVLKNLEQRPGRTDQTPTKII